MLFFKNKDMGLYVDVKETSDIASSVPDTQVLQFSFINNCLRVIHIKIIIIINH